VIAASSRESLKSGKKPPVCSQRGNEADF